MLHMEEKARRIAPFSHAARRVFIFHAQTTFVLSLAPSGAFSFVFAPRGAAACAFQNPEHRERVAEAGASRFPMSGGLAFPGLSGKRNPALRAGRNPAHAGLNPHLRCGLNLQAAPANDEAPKPFRFRGFIYPGSYLLSRDLSSDYHRRADVSLPGSEWDRVGPSGYDHQVSGSFSLLCSLLTSVIICACGLLLLVLAAGWGQQADIRVAYGLLRFPLFITLTPLHLFQAELLVTGVFV